jgi:hypothetical protein
LGAISTSAAPADHAFDEHVLIHRATDAQQGTHDYVLLLMCMSCLRRTKAAEAAVLHALPQPGTSFSIQVVQALMPWLQDLEEPLLAAAAAKGLMDLCLCWGPGSVQAAAIAVAPGSPEQLHTPAKQQSPVQQEEVGAAAGGVPQLLLVCLSSLLDQQVAANAREAPPRSR